MDEDIKEKYREIISASTSGEERALYTASLLSKELMKRRIDPDEIVGMHFEVLGEVTRGLQPNEILHTYYHASESCSS